MKRLILIVFLSISLLHAYTPEALDQAYLYSACISGETRQILNSDIRFKFIARPAQSWESSRSSKVIMLPSMSRARVIHPCGPWEDFAGADLSGAPLQGLNFRGAFFDQTDVRGANLSGAEITDAQMQGMIVDHGTIFPDGSRIMGGRRWSSEDLPLKKRWR
jgi:uncharacterized protein YjbI with pentapeptide repeats